MDAFPLRVNDGSASIARNVRLPPPWETAMPPRFDPDTIATLARVREIELETTSLDGTTTHRTTIWIVMIGDQAFIRSERGTAGRWYRETRQSPDVVVHAADEAIPVTAVPAADPDTIRQVSDALTDKYGRLSAASTAAMLEPHTLETTLRLDRRGT
jgi:hypothetical protein